MEGLVVACLSCLAVLLQFHGVFCNHMVDREHHNEERSRRYHESDCLKERERLKNVQDKTAKILRNVQQKPKSPQKSALKEKLPINERNKPKDVKNINHILEEIANVAHNHNETKGIQKIRHLVDAIANLEEKKSNLGKPVNKNKEQKENDTTVLKTSKHAKVKEVTNKPQHKSGNVLKKIATKEFASPGKTDDTAEFTKPLLTNERRFHNNVHEYYHEAPRDNYDYNKVDMENEKLIEINEHKYEEEILRSSSSSNHQASTYTNWCMEQNVHPSCYSQPYGYTRNNNDNQVYEAKYSNYPEYFYGVTNNGNNDYIVNCNENTAQSHGRKEDYTTYRKIWLDRATKIAMRDPNEYVKEIKEDRKEITNEDSPEFCRKYYSARTKQYFNSNRPSNNQYTYYTDPYHCD